MIRGTTPTLTFTMPENIMGAIKSICLAFTQTSPERNTKGDVVFEKKTEDFTIDTESGKVSVILSQEETMSLKAGKSVWFQLKVCSSGGNATVSQIWQDAVLPVVCEEVLK